MNENETLAQRILNQRRARGLSQEELAEQVGVSRQAVGKWESGQSQPDLDKVIALSRFFEVSCDWLLTGREPEAPAAPAPGGAEGNYDRQVLILATVIDLAAFILSLALWGHYQTGLCTAVALIGSAVGAGCFLACSAALAPRLGEERIRRRQLRFWQVNIWIIALPVISQLQNFPFFHLFYAPYPLLSWGALNIARWCLCWGLYLLTGLGVTLSCRRALRRMDGRGGSTPA